MTKLAKELTTANSLVNNSESEDEAVLLLCVRAEYWKARLSRRRCPSSNKVRNQVPRAVYVCRPTKSGINKV